MTAPQSLAGAELFYGELATQRASVFVRLPEASTRNGYRLTGQIRGPFSVRGETLPATHPFLDQGPGDSILVKATVPDPVHWSVDQPALYKVSLQLHEQGKQIDTCERTFAFHGIHTSGKHFRREGRTLVLRVASCECLTQEEDRSAATWLARTDGLACWVPSGKVPPEEAAKFGLPLIVELEELPSSTEKQILTQLKSLTHNPAIIAALLSPTAGAIAKQSKWPHNLLLGTRQSVTRPLEVPNWAEFVLLDLENSFASGEGEDRDQQAIKAALEIPLPVVVVQASDTANLQHARQACDTLQRRLAPLGQFSGYVI
ncbi:MAG: hypothetical protein ACO1RA_21715 [Planctomycetaceae bacterium]